MFAAGLDGSWPRACKVERIGQGAVVAVLAAALALGLVLTPSPTGTGTHTKLGLPPCGMLVVTGHPCPTCGVTTSYVMAAHGQFQEALVNQPFGLVVFVGTVGGLVFALATFISGRSWAPLATAYGVLIPLLLLLVLGLVSWGYKWATM